MIKPFYCVTSKTLYNIDGDDKQEIISGAVDYGFYGIDEDKNFIYLANRAPSEILVISKLTHAVVRRLRYGFADLHQILKIGDYIYFTDTRNNRIGKCDGVSVWFYNVTGETGKDINHINSICLRSDLLYVMSPKTSEDYSKILVCDIRHNCKISKQILLPKAMYHDILIIGDVLYTVNGGKCNIVGYNLRNSDILIVNVDDPDKYFCRGLDFNGEHFLVGCSDRGHRSIRHNLNGKVLILDKNMVKVKEINFGGDGQMHQVKFRRKYD